MPKQVSNNSITVPVWESKVICALGRSNEIRYFHWAQLTIAELLGHQQKVETFDVTQAVVQEHQWMDPNF